MASPLARSWRVFSTVNAASLLRSRRNAWTGRMPFIVSANFTMTAAIAVDRAANAMEARRRYSRTIRYSGTKESVAIAPIPRSSQSSTRAIDTNERTTPISSWSPSFSSSRSDSTSVVEREISSPEV